jgi:hypothetical protein
MRAVDAGRTANEAAARRAIRSTDFKDLAMDLYPV